MTDDLFNMANTFILYMKIEKKVVKKIKAAKNESTNTITHYLVFEH